MMRITKFFLVVFLLVLGLAPAASARLVAAGPVNPGNGFPLYYVDSNGVAVELPVPPLGTALFDPPPLNPISPTMVFDPPIVGNLFSEKIGFGSECFYWVADADFTGVPSTVGVIVYRAGLEAAFAGGEALNGDQMVFSRIRVRVKDITVPGTYVVHHPYGEESIDVTAADITAGKGINMTRDIGLTPLNFAEALNGDVGPFLVQTAPIAFANLPVPPAPPYPLTGWIGDGTTPSTVTGSPLGFNAVSITPPAGVNIGAGPGAALTTNFFIVSGHKYPLPIPTPLTMNRVTYTRTRSATYFDVFATSSVGSTVTAKIASPRLLSMPGGVDALNGLYFIHAPYANASTRGYRANPFNPSADVTVTSQLGANLPTTFTHKAVDLVTISQAVWHTSTQTLTVTARSSDTKVRPTLTLVNPALGTLVGGIKNQVTPIPPPEVIVSSSAGGVATKAVTVITP
jgi:hypothetical protein